MLSLSYQPSHAKVHSHKSNETLLSCNLRNQKQATKETDTSNIVLRFFFGQLAGDERERRREGEISDGSLGEVE